MTHALIRYSIRPEHRADNEAKVRAVFRQLHQSRPEGVRYLVLANEAGEFVHIAASDANPGGLTGLPAFQAFQDGHAGRRDGALSRSAYVLVGEYWPQPRS